MFSLLCFISGWLGLSYLALPGLLLQRLASKMSRKGECVYRSQDPSPKMCVSGHKFQVYWGFDLHSTTSRSHGYYSGRIYEQKNIEEKLGQRNSDLIKERNLSKVTLFIYWSSASSQLTVSRMTGIVVEKLCGVAMSEPRHGG